MDSFLKFIDEDIEAKKTLFSTMPTNTKTNKKKFNEKIDSVTSKYNEYKNAVKKYLDTKSKSFNIKATDLNKDKLLNAVKGLEHVKFLLNPSNTYIEKMGFDSLLYQISNYSDFNFKDLNEIINKFLDKFELAGIKLLVNDFDYTCYVYEYMVSFLEARNKKSNNYDKVSEIFEHIYWVNPEIIEHIELNFRKLIRKYDKKFIGYISKTQKEVMSENKVSSYEDCLSKLKTAYNELNIANKENINDIINMAKSGSIDMNIYFENNKTRVSTYESLMINPIDFNDKTAMSKFYESLEKLKINVEEYSNYVKFLPLINDFKKEYEKQIANGEKSVESFKLYEAENDKTLKNISTQIDSKESKLEKLNKEIIRSETGLFESKKSNAMKQQKIDSVKQAKELYSLYKAYDQEYFKDKVICILNCSTTISELLHLYYSFDYFKKSAIKKSFSVTTYDEIIKYSESFDLFANNPTNIITNGIALFEDNNISNIIMKKYRLDNINLNEEALNPDDLKSLLERIQLLLRINEIENSSTNVEKIWFMAQVEKINIRETKK